MLKRLKQEFLLDPDVIFLNHGSFGACPRPVFETYRRWQAELERQPVEFLGRRLNDPCDEAPAPVSASDAGFIRRPNRHGGGGVLSRPTTVQPRNRTAA